MREKQLRLMPSAKPLTERFGPEFFRALPKCPGVYFMFDERGHCIYIGQSKNLRQRVNSYRYVHPDRSSRKIIRLVHSVARIQWELCETPNAAKLRENFLLREHRPRFNKANTYPKIHCFIGLRLSADRWEFRYTREEANDGFDYFGAFKSGCLAGFAALLRLLWIAIRQPVGWHEFPHQLSGEKPPRQFTFSSCDVQTLHRCGVAAMLREFFEGHSTRLVGWLESRNSIPGDASLFQKNFLASDFEQINLFFKFGPQRNAALRTRHRLPGPLIAQEALDDLLISGSKETLPMAAD